VLFIVYIAKHEPKQKPKIETIYKTEVIYKSKEYTKKCPNCNIWMEKNHCIYCGYGYKDVVEIKPIEQKPSRHISEKVRTYVWRRDEGKCVECGSKMNLEYDHIIPYSKGGSSTARNIQLLCEKCNRKKTDKIE